MPAAWVAIAASRRGSREAGVYQTRLNPPSRGRGRGCSSESLNRPGSRACCMATAPPMPLRQFSPNRLRYVAVAAGFRFVYGEPASLDRGLCQFAEPLLALGAFWSSSRVNRRCCNRWSRRYAAGRAAASTRATRSKPQLRCDRARTSEGSSCRERGTGSGLTLSRSDLLCV